MITFLWTDPTPVRGPLTFARLRELWDEGKIKGESKLFLTERDDQTSRLTHCFALKAEQIRHNLETGVEISVNALVP